MASDTPLEGLLGPAETTADSAKADARPAQTVIAELAEELLPTLIARLDSSRLGELEVRQDGWRIRLRRAGIPAPDGAEVAPVTPRRGERRAERAAADRPIDASAESRPRPPRAADRGTLTVTSPGVGYYQPRDGLAIGTNLRAGDVLGHVDVLGVKQEVVATEDGLLAALQAEAGEAVEYGQALARIERPDRRG